MQAHMYKLRQRNDYFLPKVGKEYEPAELPELPPVRPIEGSVANTEEMSRNPGRYPGTIKGDLGLSGGWTGLKGRMQGAVKRFGNSAITAVERAFERPEPETNNFGQ